MIQSVGLDALREMLAAGRECTVPVRGTSMNPFLVEGDQLSLRALSSEGLRLGDLMAFEQEGRLIVHRCAGRVIRQGHLRYRQKGDNQSGFSLVEPAQVVGRVGEVMRGNHRLDLEDPAARWEARLRGLYARTACLLLEGRACLGRCLRRTSA